MADQVISTEVEPIGTDPNADQIVADDKPTSVETPSPAPGQTEKTKVETPEDIEKSRAYHQTKAQQEAEARKALESKYTAALKQLEGLDAPAGLPQAPEPDIYKEPEVASPQSTETNDDDDPYGIGRIVEKKLTAFQRQQQEAERARQQAAMQQRFDNEYDIANKTVIGFMKDNGIPDDIVRKAAEEANYYVVGDVIGGPTKQAKMMLRHMNEYIKAKGFGITAAEQLAKDQSKIAQMNQTAQPVGAALDTPLPGSAKTTNDQLADEIAPDDPVI
jgi:hypothetical protein